MVLAGVHQVNLELDTRQVTKAMGSGLEEGPQTGTKGDPLRASQVQQRLQLVASQAIAAQQEEAQAVMDDWFRELALPHSQLIEKPTVWMGGVNV